MSPYRPLLLRHADRGWIPVDLDAAAASISTVRLQGHR